MNEQAKLFRRAELLRWYHFKNRKTPTNAPIKLITAPLYWERTPSQKRYPGKPEDCVGQWHNETTATVVVR